MKKLISLDIDGTLLNSASFTDLPLESMQSNNIQDINFRTFGYNNLNFNIDSKPNCQEEKLELRLSFVRLILQQIKQGNVILINTSNDSIKKSNLIIRSIIKEVDKIKKPEFKKDILQKLNDNFLISLSYGARIYNIHLKNDNMEYITFSEHLFNITSISELKNIFSNCGLNYNFEKIETPVPLSLNSYPKNLEIASMKNTECFEPIFLINRLIKVSNDFDYEKEIQTLRKALNNNSQFGLEIKYTSPFHIAIGQKNITKTTAIQEVADAYKISNNNCFMIGNTLEDLIENNIAKTIVLTPELHCTENIDLRSNGAYFVLDINQAFNLIDQLGENTQNIEKEHIL